MPRAVIAVGRQAVVHVKVDTGMHRVGLAPDRVLDFVGSGGGPRGLALEGFWTHLPVADGEKDEDREYTAPPAGPVRPAPGRPRVDRGPALGPSRRQHGRCHRVPPGALRHRAGRLGLYGEVPQPVGRPASWPGSQGGARLQPVLALRARVVALRGLEAGERPSYGRARPLPESSFVATVPVGYADGVPRRLFDGGGEVLIGGRRRPLAGVVTMDQIMVDCGPTGASVGDEVVLLGRQGDEEITASEWASRLGTIAYEVLCGIGPRVPRVIRGEARPGLRHRFKW